MTGVTSPIMPENDSIGGVSRAGSPGIGGYEYAGGINVAPILDAGAWPLPIPGNDTQGIAIDPLWTFGVPNPTVNDTEGPAATYFNGGVAQIPVQMAQFPKYVANDVDLVESSWNTGNTNPSPYQVDTNLMGPVTGNSENMNGNTLQPDYNPQGQYGAATGGGTSQHETTVAYYVGQTDQVQRDYSASAMFASV